MDLPGSEPRKKPRPDHALKGLRLLYLSEADEKLKTLRAAITGVKSQNPAAAKTLALALNNLYGSGATYGFPYLSRLGRKGCELLGPHADKNAPLPAELIAQLENLVDILEIYFQKAVEVNGEALPEAGFSETRDLKANLARPPLKAEDPAGKKKILVVDPDPTVCKNLEAAISDPNLQWRRLAEVDEVLQTLNQERPDLLVISLDLPAPSGAELIQRIRKIPSQQLTPIIAVSARTTRQSRVQCLSAGANYCISGPAPEDELKAAVISELDHGAKIKALAFYDPLTGAYTRRYIFERLLEETYKHQRRLESLSVAILDLDHFKKINDDHGHLVGDEILKRLIQFLKSNLRPSDLIGRYGGDEFILIMPGTDLGEAREILNRVRQKWAETPQRVKELEMRTTFSAGLTMLDKAEMEITELLFHSDRALYYAKDAGRNRVVSEVV